MVALRLEIRGEPHTKPEATRPALPGWLDKEGKRKASSAETKPTAGHGAIGREWIGACWFFVAAGLLLLLRSKSG